MGNTNFNFEPNEQIATGVVFLVAGIVGLVKLTDETSVKLIIGAFLLPPIGIFLTIAGIARKLRKPNRPKSPESAVR